MAGYELWQTAPEWAKDIVKAVGSNNTFASIVSLTKTERQLAVSVGVNGCLWRDKGLYMASEMKVYPIEPRPDMAASIRADVKALSKKFDAYSDEAKQGLRNADKVRFV